MTTSSATAPAGVIRSTIPARIDRLPWSPFHTRMVVALGIAWILDGLEITVAGAVSGKLTDPGTLHLSAASVALASSVSDLLNPNPNPSAVAINDALMETAGMMVFK